MKTYLVILLFGVVFSVLLGRDGVKAWCLRRGSVAKRVAVALGLLLAAAVVAGGFVAASTERIVYHDEATVLSTAAAFHHGQPLYPSADAPVEYGLLYGPTTFLVYVPPMLAGAERVGVYQAWVAAGLGCTFLMAFFALRARFGRDCALLCCGYLAVFVALLTINEWAVKGDCWILFFSALGLLAALRLPGWAAVLVLALAGGALLDVKVTLLLAAWLPCIVLFERGREHRLPAVSAATLIPMVALLPFALHRVSLHGYAEQLRAAAHNGYSARNLRFNVRFMSFMLLPPLGLFWAAWSKDSIVAKAWMLRHRVFLVALAAAALVALFTGAKNGAGPWHCMAVALPLMLVNAELYSLGLGSGVTFATIPRPGLVPILAIGSGLLVMACQGLAWGIARRFTDGPGAVPVSMPALERDLVRLQTEHPGVPLQMGYSDTAHYDFTFVRPILQMRGEPLMIDADARNEADLIRAPYSPAVLKALGSCAVELWVLPKGGEPFSMEAPYFLDNHAAAERDLFPAAFRKVFFATYEKLPEVDPYYDLWGCRAGKKAVAAR